MAARAFLTTMGVVAAAGLALAVPAQADTNDSFLNALSNAGIGYTDPGSTVQLGQQVCPMLVEPGKNFASVASQMRGNNGMSPEMASFFTGIAIQMYCPQMMSSITDGSILNNLGGLNALSGIAGFPGFGQ
ncbi:MULTISPECIES: DUF732 domain-containing protein [Mycolicibacterium]|uniref:DUF732 domain-containing protein n=1 Tax=Mycolicibacterium brisbanense TaxID=146020 RepID=A0A100W0W7_9MYCO|nr:DUF732 domain-containing protein [Mycolicibacterium brisbanense]MCV7156893.1 DUF732 domain-containing protein [Mycolicibacterium brisbanense]GAS89611.1 uncharacterized protein RMCB_3707 [Mycolicibacterium brisbanense]